MKLYKIKVLHAAPKDWHQSIETYLIAKNDEEVFNWIDENKAHHLWSEHEKWLEDDEESGYYLDDKPCTMKEWVLVNKGDIDDDNGWEDAYYGVTKWGWELVDETWDVDYDSLIKLRIAVKA